MDSMLAQGSNEKLFARAANSFGEDDSGSDVSASPSDIESSLRTVQKSPAGPDHRSISTSDTKSHLQAESLSAIKQRLLELDGVEDVLVTKRNKLAAKRKRKDEKIQSRLAEDDARIKREREEEDARRALDRMAKEDRIRKRREREDAEYRGKEKAHDDEEYELRRRLKNLKRGPPVDEEKTENRRPSTLSESMSPPAKKHQPNPAPNQALNSPARLNTLQPLQPQQDQQPKPQYPYYYGWNPPPPVTGPYAYGPSEPYQPRNQPNPPQNSQPPLATLPNGGPPRFNPPAPPPRHGPSPKAIPPISHAQSPRNQARAPVPPPGPSHYDVRPPSATSNFTSINAPPSGFPSINQPPTHAVKTPIRPATKAKRAHHSSAKAQAPAPESGVHHSPAHPPGNSPTDSTTLSGKRKASTTHPYSQSEAFANRHHHCERTDELDRGIWTYFGPGGTKEAPTVAGKKEMYLRCNHNDCMRIDWKTVHGLQCHIVKNHGIPKGTIGSLELALEKYGVEVQEIEEHEKKHGLGSAGAMAEKGSRGRPRASRPSNEIVLPQASGATSGTTAGPIVAPTKPTPAARPKPSGPIVLFPNLAARTPNGGYVQDDIVYSEEESDGDESSVEIKQAAPRRVTGPAQWKASDSELSTPSTSRAGGDGEFRLSIPRAAPAQQGSSHTIDGMKSPEPRPTSSTETLAVADSAPTSTESLPPPPPTKLPLHSITQTPPMGTETQRIVSAAERVNARLDAEDPDFVASATPSESNIPSQTQIQNQTQNQTTQRTGDHSQDTAMATSTKNPSTSSTSSRPRGGAETQRRVKASERWDWAPIEDDDGNTTATNSTSATATTKKKRDGSSTGLGLTKAQQELQGIDGSVGAAEGEGGEDDVGSNGGTVGGGGGGEDGNGNGNGSVMRSLKSPATSRYSARKKTRRRVDV